MFPPVAPVFVVFIIALVVPIGRLIPGAVVEPSAYPVGTVVPEPPAITTFPPLVVMSCPPRLANEIYPAPSSSLSDQKVTSPPFVVMSTEFPWVIFSVALSSISASIAVDVRFWLIAMSPP